MSFFEGSAEGNAGLYARIRGIRHGAKGIHRLEVSIAKKAEDIAVKAIGTGAGDDVDDAAGGAAVFRGVVVGDDLKFLHVLLGNSGADAVDGVVGGVGAVDIHQIRTRTLAAHVEAGGGCSAEAGSVVTDDLGIGEREVDVVAAIDGKIVDAALADGVGGGAARGLDEIGLRIYFDDFAASSNFERYGKFDRAADGDDDVGVFNFGEAWSFDSDGIGAGRQLANAVAAFAVAGGGALHALCDFASGHGCVGDQVPLGVFDRDMQIAGGHAALSK